MKTMTNKEPLKLFKALTILMLAMLLFPKIAFGEDIKHAEKPQERQTIRELIFAAEKGDAQAQIKLGLRYEEGDGVDRNEKEALKWIQRAAEKNIPAAQNMVALYYANGKGVAVNNEEAVKWFRLAAAQNFAESQYFVGLYYANGTGVTKDKKEGARFYGLAAEQGHDRAAYALGQCYSVGDGVPKDDIEAIKWISLAAVFGDERGVPGLRMLKNGKTPEQLAEADKRVKEFINNRSSRELTTIAAQSVVNKGDKANAEGASPYTGIKAFDDLFFGEEKAIVERKQKKNVKIGERLFEFSCGYENIEGKERLSQVNLSATWTDVEEDIIKKNLDEFKQVLSMKFGEPHWQIGTYQGKIWSHEASKERVTSLEELRSIRDKYAADQRYLLQYQWKMGEEKIVNVWMRDRTYKKERKEMIEVQSANWFRDAKTEEVSRFDEHREYKVWIQIESPAVKKMKAKESANPF